MPKLFRCLWTLLPLLTAGCAVHQWPEPNPATLERVTVRLRYEPDFWVWEHLYDPLQGTSEELWPDGGLDADHPGTTEVYDNTQTEGVMAILLKVYRAGSDRSEADCIFLRDLTAEGYDCEVDIELFEGAYEVVVWSHLLEEREAPSFYDPGTFRVVSLVDERYRACTDYRDGFFGRTTFAFLLPEEAAARNAGEERVCEVTMRRPMGKFEFVTTDLSEFLDRETERRALSTRASVDDYRVVITYPYYYPNAYNQLSDDIASGSGYRFETKLTVTGAGEATMGFDYVFMRNTPDGAVQAQVAVYDLAGTRVANSQVVRVPIRRDWHTVFRGAFLSVGAQGGVGVNPDFEGDHNVTFP